MRERPGQRCLWSEPASRWRPTRDPTGWKCLQNTLTHWQRKTRLHSCFPAIVCTASSVCIFILCLFIKFYVIFPLLYFLRKKKKEKKNFTALECLDIPGWVVVQFSLYLAALMEEQLNRTKEEFRHKSTDCPPALPFGRKNCSLEKQCGQGYSYLVCSLSVSESPQPYSVLQLWCRYFRRCHGIAATPAVGHTNPRQFMLLCAEQRQVSVVVLAPSE